MHNLLSLLFGTLIANAAWGGSTDSPVLDTEWSTVDGHTIRLEDYRGDRPVYLKFWASWCGTCLKEMPHLQSVHRDHGDEIAVIAVNLGINDDRKAVIETRDQFSLSMPIVIDRDGLLAQAFDLVATPYHVLLDRDLRLVHAEYSASNRLDERIRQLAAGNDGELEAIEAGTNQQHDNRPAETARTKPRSSGGFEVLFFIATWCHWYLEDTRPAMSRNCIDAQQVINTLYRQYPDLEWIGVASRMWTGQKELDAYRERFNVKHPLAIDGTNDTIQHHDIRQFPSLIVLQEGQEVLRIQDFGDPEKVTRKFEDAVSRAVGLTNADIGVQDVSQKVCKQPATADDATRVTHNFREFR